MIQSRIVQHQVQVFFAITLAISACIAALAKATNNENLSILIVFSPTLTAIFIAGIVDRKQGLVELLVWKSTPRISLRWIAVALLLVPTTAAVALGLHSFFDGPSLSLRSTSLFPELVVILLISLGEEYGWRGFALPRLQQRYTALVSSIILGLVWGLWHFPGYLIGVGVPLDMPFLVFMFWVMAITIVMTCVYNHTRSVLATILMHSAANATFNYLPLLPEFTGQMTTFTIFLSLLWIVTMVAIVYFGPKRLSQSH